MSRHRTTLPVADTATDARVRVLADPDTGTESEIRFGAAPPRDVPAAETVTPITAGGDAECETRPSLRQRTFRVRRAAADILVMALIAVAAFAIWPVRLGGGHLVIHRIIGRSHGGYLMQGDNRETPDSWYPKANDVLGKFRLLVPLPGIQFWAWVPWICCGAIGLAVMWILWPRRPESHPTTEPEGADHPTDLTATGAITTGPVPVGARRLRRLEREQAAQEHHSHPRRRVRRSNHHATP